MPKKIYFESAVHQFLFAAERIALSFFLPGTDAHKRWSKFVLSLGFEYTKAGTVTVRWSFPKPGERSFSFESSHFYLRGDTEDSVGRQRATGMLFSSDVIQRENADFFQRIVLEIATGAGLLAANGIAHVEPPGGRLNAEENFHDEWASTEDALRIDVRKMNEACTAPEIRFIRSVLGNLKGKSLLDLGCGLGEASVYFALEGANVTASDLSQLMLDFTKRLAEKNRVQVRTHKAAAEQLAFGRDVKFDIIYAGNLFHHVEIEPALRNMVRHLQPDGLLVSWDPVAYNPAINAYRVSAQQVRTPDEHPLRLRDIRLFRSYFEDVRVRWFWLTTLVIFVIMRFFQGRDPNKERYWKKVVEEADQWAWLYRPLEFLDRILYAVFPFLRPLSWNVVIVARKPRFIF
jgi:SAM-dependent methyltransferase